MRNPSHIRHKLWCGVGVVTMNVGDEMILVESNFGRGEQRQIPVKVRTIGRKYFTVDVLDGSMWWLDNAKFHLDSGLSAGETNYPHRVTTKETLAREQRRSQAEQALRDEGISFGYNSNLTADQLEAILAIVRGAA